MTQKRLLGVIIISLFAIKAFSQVNFRPGFIITNDQDTINGEIDYRGDIRMCKLCTFKTKEKGKKTYYPDEIAGYRFENDRFFVTGNIDGKLKFLELLISGEVRFYYYNDNTKPRYFFNGSNGELVELKYFERTVNINEFGQASDGINYRVTEHTSSKGYGQTGEYSFKSQEFKKILLDSLQMEGNLSEEINNMKKPDHESLINLAVKYHEMNGSSKELVIYYDLHKKSDYLFSICWLNINYKDFLTDESFLMYSFKGYAPLDNPKLYLGYGFQYSPVKLKNNTYRLFRLPFSIRYQYPGNYIKPHAAIGLNVYAIYNGENTEFIRDFVPSYTIGLAVKIYKNIHLSCNLEGDFLRNSDYNSSGKATFSQTNNIGLMITL